MDETDQSKVNSTQADKAKFEIMSRIADEETRAFLKEQGEKQKKQWCVQRHCCDSGMTPGGLTFGVLPGRPITRQTQVARKGRR